ncbi:glycerophosphodiester phosphodiesterase [Corynebacterium sp. c9Ua_112]|uniref:Glycerophosphodiester phosphodiesterase n=1 Tax=Corynebacterium macclintockiae TaxID=2913501 RepID=A0A9X3M8F1_9CORY|nr:glycerophosphodiester phosphodiesterase family protein [Corynebacterium macclintockiae]MCZ9305543.1 glycerophosphodiester phosphodiesterase [Corynebacterium macclintockiae]MDK8870277.1 glycerophosphodiester phosphodiesterase family protein [Corynebacterium macclintockiae]
MKIVAHRGASKERPEHTLAAYELAEQRGADGFECDIRLTRDGELVCIHDRTIDRVAVEKPKKSSGVISEMTLAELRELNVGTPEEPAQVLTLRELLTFFNDINSSRVSAEPGHSQRPGGLSAEGGGASIKKEIFIETKHPNRYGPKVEHALHYELQRAHLADSPHVHLISFSPQSLVRFKMINPGIHRILLRREYQRMLNPGLQALHVVDAHGLSVARGRIRPDIIGRFGDGTYMWTADKEDEVRWATRQGVTWLATNYPGRARMWRDSENGVDLGNKASAPTVVEEPGVTAIS